MPSQTTLKSSRSATSSKTASKTAENRKTGASPARKPSASRASQGPASITNYTTAVRWLMDHIDYERLRIVPYNKQTFNLERMGGLLKLMGDPQDELKCVQIAGTKGKGSTCAMLASMLQACGYTVGLYTSPHLVDMRERITINGQMVSHADMAEILRTIAGLESKLPHPNLSYFEILTAAALRHFANEAVDIVILECGLGGRLDSTTIVNPLVTGVTQISYDHMNILGKSLPEIAREKAGIFKKGVPAISVEQDASILPVFEQVAQDVGTAIEFTGRDIDFSFRFEANRELGPHTRVCLTTSTSRFEHLPVPLRGEHQALNCGLALAMLDKLRNHGFNLPEEQVVAGLAQTRINGRMEQVWNEPRVLIDGAHNAASIQSLIRALGAHISYDSLVLIFGCGQDKDINGMLKQISLGADKVIFTKARHNSRAVEPEELMSKFIDLTGKMAQTAPSLEEALKLAGRAVSREDLIVITGSFYLAGESRKYFTELAQKRNRK